MELHYPDTGLLAVNVDQWERAKEIFDAALRLPIEERSQFVTDACRGDTRLLREVNGLLDADQQANSFLNTPAIKLDDVFDIHSSADRPQVDLLPEGELVSGRFEIKRLLGQGGMGQVYETRDTELGVRVALKTIRPDITLAWRRRATLARGLLCRQTRNAMLPSSRRTGHASIAITA